tara:strand:- start:211 stop:993 length:783 start_codon:yes stop_codon:yes gene_type:complete
MDWAAGAASTSALMASISAREESNSALVAMERAEFQQACEVWSIEMNKKFEKREEKLAAAEHKYALVAEKRAKLEADADKMEEMKRCVASSKRVIKRLADQYRDKAVIGFLDTICADNEYPEELLLSWDAKVTPGGGFMGTMKRAGEKIIRSATKLKHPKELFEKRMIELGIDGEIALQFATADLDDGQMSPTTENERLRTGMNFSRLQKQRENARLMELGKKTTQSRILALGAFGEDMMKDASQGLARKAAALAVRGGK